MPSFVRVVMLLLVLTPGVSTAREFELSPNGFGPVRMGMSPEQAGKLLGTPLVTLPATYQDDRRVVVPKTRYAGISFTVSAAGVIDGVYVAFDARRFRTDRNLGIGSSANDIWQRYGSQIEVKAYQCGSAFLIYTYRSTRTSNYGVTYTVSATGLVEGIMAGDLKTVVLPC